MIIINVVNELVIIREVVNTASRIAPLPL